jgi:hypothetical protein
MHLLVFINTSLIVMDVGLLCMEYASLFLLETVFKGVCYSIKLKCELAILSRLVTFVRDGQRWTAAAALMTNGSYLPQTSQLDPAFDMTESRHIESIGSKTPLGELR